MIPSKIDVPAPSPDSRDRQPLRIGMIALGGCIKAPPIAFGLTPDTGGHITYLMDEALALAERADVAAVDIYTRRFDAPYLGPEYAEAEERVSDKVRILRVSSDNPRYLSKEALADDLAGWTAALIERLEQEPRPDIFHAHFADAAAAASAVRERFKIPYVFTAHSLAADKSDAMRELSEGLTRRLAQEGAAIAGADAVIGSSRDECERQLMRYEGARPERIHHVAPGVARIPEGAADTNAARRLIAPFLREPGKPFLLAIARPVEKKNLVALIDAYGCDKELRKRANLVILAGLRDDIADEEDECRQVHRAMLDTIDRHDLYGSIAYPKRHTRNEADGLYALAREQRGLFVNNALFEPYGLTIVEAAAHGLPVIVTDQGGPKDIISHYGHGVAVDPRDGAALARAANRLLGDHRAWARHSASALEKVDTGQWDVYAARFLSVARGLLPKNAVRQPRPDLLVLCDIDNTLTGCAAGARRFGRLIDRQSAWAFGVATGRSLQQADMVLDRWDLPHPRVMITSVGSEIYWCASDGARERDDDFSLMIREGWHPKAVEAALAKVAGLAPQPLLEQREFKRSYTFDDPSVVAEVRARFDDAGLDARVIASHATLLDILPARAGKAAALFWVASKLGIRPERVVAAGDSGNDEDMLAACPNAVLVANHEPALAHLIGRKNVHAAARPHALGVVEGVLRASRSMRRAAA
ncbi:HAD-IIB family hydrolase [Sphingomicrobium sp. XHP0235]|uniref:HAD-IIB family hydrolase n=1 Tax=Sphingomicrobium aquimarinum TaxID=3133971 RepID=UPI0031FE5506